MGNLIKHHLKYDLTWSYINDNLKGGNTLSLELINLLDFNKGDFFTLLPVNANLLRLHEFLNGGILTKQSTKEYYLSEERNTYSLIPTIQDEIGNLIKNIINNNQRLVCVFEEILDSPKSPQLNFFYDKDILYVYDKEVYYLLRPDKSIYELILKCLEKSNAIWHSLCILTEVDFTNLSDRKFTLKKIQEVCRKAKIVLIGAYDGEGYIFWEKKCGSSDK